MLTAINAVFDQHGAKGQAIFDELMGNAGFSKRFTRDAKGHAAKSELPAPVMLETLVLNLEGSGEPKQAVTAGAPIDGSDEPPF